jgi:hypothetical protein
LLLCSAELIVRAFVCYPVALFSGEVHDAMVASMSEGLVRLAVDPAVSSLPRRASAEKPQLGEWELIAQLQVGTRNFGSVDPGLRIDGRSISEVHMDAIDELCNQAAQATKIQRYDSLSQRRFD